MRRSRSINVVLALCALLTTTVLTRCAHNPPNTTPQANVAHYGTDVVQAVNQVQAAIIAATETTPPVLTVERATPIMNDIRRGLDDATQLSSALKAYDAATSATDKQNLAMKIEALLSVLSAALNSAQAPDLPPSLVSQTSQLVANVSTTIATIRAALALNAAPKGGGR